MMGGQPNRKARLMSLATTDEQRALQDSVRSWAQRCAPIDWVREVADCEKPGRTALPDSWGALANLGLLAIHLGEDVGGAGGTVADLAAGLEESARVLAPGPVLATALAGLLLSRSDEQAATVLLPSLADGSTVAAVALSTQGVCAERDGEGFRVRGTAAAVPDAAFADLVVLGSESPEGEVWFVADADTPGLDVDVPRPLDPSHSPAHLRLDLAVPGDRVLVELTQSVVRDAAAVLVAAEASGVASWAVRTAVEHAKQREQFGRPVGSFQAVKHLCTQMLCRYELVAAAAWDAAQAYESEDDGRGLSAACAAAVALDAAVDNAKDCIQVLGGIGYTWEHEAHLYLRRALSLRQLLGGSARWRARSAELALSGRRRQARVSLAGRAERTREEVRDIARRVEELPTEQRRAALADAGLLAPHWPPPYGRGAGAVEQLVIDEVLAEEGVTRPSLMIAGWALPPILEHGTEQQRDRFVRPSLHGRITWCQLFSEPGAGSDLASLRTRAERVDRGWRLTGQKVWTSLAHEADWAICLARTNPDAPKHNGITYFLVDMHSPGVEVRPLREMTGESLFNEVFLDGVVVPDDCVVGEVDGGWRLARSTLANERVAMSGGSSLGTAVEELLGRAVESGVADDAVTRDRLGALVAEGHAVSMVGLRATLRSLRGDAPGPESSVQKLVGVEHRQTVAETALELLGACGAVVDDRTAPVVHEMLVSRCLSIAGGTTQVLRNLVGERVLGLPREPATS
jgi:3-oxochol-4-en-24-oyl-CoA dehydrogenase